MRINIDDDLLQQAMKISGLKSKKAVVELALQEYIHMIRRGDLLSLFGKVEWDGDLEKMRTDDPPNEWDQ